MSERESGERRIGERAVGVEDGGGEDSQQLGIVDSRVKGGFVEKVCRGCCHTALQHPSVLVLTYIRLRMSGLFPTALERSERERSMFAT